MPKKMSLLIFSRTGRRIREVSVSRPRLFLLGVLGGLYLFLNAIVFCGHHRLQRSAPSIEHLKQIASRQATRIASRQKTLDALDLEIKRLKAGLPEIIHARKKIMAIAGIGPGNVQDSRFGIGGTAMADTRP